MVPFIGWLKVQFWFPFGCSASLRCTTGAFGVLFHGVLSQKMVGNNVLFYRIVSSTGNKKKFKPHSQNRILVYLLGVLFKISDKQPLSFL